MNRASTRGSNVREHFPRQNQRYCVGCKSKTTPSDAERIRAHGASSDVHRHHCPIVRRLADAFKFTPIHHLGLRSRIELRERWQRRRRLHSQFRDRRPIK